MPLLYFDTETRSATPINRGTVAYAEDPEAKVIMWQWAVDDGEVHATSHLTDELRALLLDPAYTIVCHNSYFDRTCLRIMEGMDIPVQRWLDTMVQAMAHSLPGSLDTLSDIYKLGDMAKSKAGKRLIQLFCCPRPKNHKLRWATAETHPADWEAFLEYGKLDVEAMRQLHTKMPKWNYPNNRRELELWWLDQKINDRGICVDQDLISAALEATGREQKRLAKEASDLTGGFVGSATQRNAVLAWLAEEHDIQLDDLKASTVERLADEGDLPPVVLQLLQIRGQASKTSTAKYKRAREAMAKDGRLHGTKQFCGASRTGRWGGRVFQPDNLPRPSMDAKEIEFGIAALKAGAADLFYDDIMELSSSAIRGVIVPTRGKKLVVADLSNIEGRGLAWLAGEEWKLQAFRDYDTIIGYKADGKPIRKGFDLYVLAYAQAFGVDPSTVAKPQRQIGKVMELALGYSGGVGAFLTFALAYGIDLDEMAERAYDSIPQDVIDEAKKFYDWLVKKKASTYGMAEKTFIVCDSFKRMWRRAHPEISTWWQELEDAVRGAINFPGELFTARSVKTKRNGKWLRIQLPSGRHLCYLNPEVDEKGNISYMGVNQYTRKWRRIKTYSGKLAENCLAGDTKVLTDGGWKYLVDVANTDKVWDGNSWVSHGGLIYQGERETMNFGGVRLTPDHKVYTNGIPAEARYSDYEKAASSFQRLNRLPNRDVGSDSLCRLGWAKRLLACSLRLWRREIASCFGDYKGQNKIVRLQSRCCNIGVARNARINATSTVLDMAQYESSLHKSETQSMGKLRRSWDNCLRVLARLQQFLFGRIPHLFAGFGARQNRQLKGIFTSEFSLGEPASQLSKPARQSFGDSGREANYRCRGVAENRDWCYDTLVPTRQEGAAGSVVRETVCKEPVFDLLNCGPDHRFTVQGADGRPFLVSNCTQAFARDILAYNLPGVEAAGYEIVLTVHDEDVTEAPNTPEFSADRLSELMVAPHAWAPNLPLAAAGFEASRYRKDD